jgi:hypothetical protein
VKQAVLFHPAGTGEFACLAGREMVFQTGYLPVNVGKSRFHEQMIHPPCKGDRSFFACSGGSGRIGDICQVWPGEIRAMVVFSSPREMTNSVHFQLWDLNFVSGSAPS